MTVFVLEETSARGVSVMDACQVLKNTSEERSSNFSPAASWNKNSASAGPRGGSLVCLEEEFSEKLHCSVFVTDSVRIDHPYASEAISQVIDRSDLASLIETCELDTDFLKEAVKDKENFQHFLDDVISNCDVPADDIVLGLLDAEFSHRVSAKSPYLPAPSLNSCLFSTAGSTEPRLCASVSCSLPTTACAPSAPREPVRFQTTAAPSALTFSSSAFLCSSSSSSTSTTSSSSSTSTTSGFCAAEEKTGDDSVDFRFEEVDDNITARKVDIADDDQCDLTIGFPRLQDVGELQAGLDNNNNNSNNNNNNVFCPETKDLLCGDCLSVSLSHRISNGVCLLCSAARLMKVRDSCGCQELSYFSTPLRLSIPDADIASSGRVSPQGGKRKSQDDGHKAGSAEASTASWKRARLESACADVVCDGPERVAKRDSPIGHSLDPAAAHASGPWEAKDDHVADSKDDKSIDAETESAVDMLSLFHPDSLAAEDPVSLMMEQRFL